MKTEWKKLFLGSIVGVILFTLIGDLPPIKW